MTNKPESNRLKELKQEVLIAYLNQQIPGLSKFQQAEWKEKYKDARKRLADCIATELQ